MNVSTNRMYYRQIAKSGFFFLAFGVVLGILVFIEVRSHGWSGAVVMPFQMKGTGEHPKLDVKAAAFLSSLLFGGGLIAVCLGINRADGTNN